jgi:acyl-CoA dehydrogenase
MSDNIIHLVLARIEGAPEGVKGISLFIVPKFMVGDDGSLGERNPVSCGSLEEKMGIHGNATCVMNYDEATGYLIGAENAGLKAMFVMMNEARLGVGLQGQAMGPRSPIRTPYLMPANGSRAARSPAPRRPRRRPIRSSCIPTCAAR